MLDLADLFPVYLNRIHKLQERVLIDKKGVRR